MSHVDERIWREIVKQGICLTGRDLAWNELSNREKRKGLHRLAFLADELEITQEELCAKLVQRMIGNRYRGEHSTTLDQLIEIEVLDIEALDRLDDAVARSGEDWLSWAACNRILRRARLRHRLIPEPLKDWSTPEPTKPRSVHTELLNELVTACVRIGSESGLSVYRNETTERESVIDIVADCLNQENVKPKNGKVFGYDTVRKIMNRRWSA